MQHLTRLKVLRRAGIGAIMILTGNCLLSATSFSQSRTQITIRLHSGTDKARIKFSFDDGRGEYAIVPGAKGTTLRITQPFHTEFATLTITYSSRDGADISKTFIVDNRPAIVTFREPAKLANNPLDKFSAVNATEINQTAGGRKLLTYTRATGDSLLLYAERLGNKSYNEDSTKQKFRYYDSLLILQERAFMDNNPGDFFSLWFFRSRYIPSYFFYPPDTLLNMYQRWFAPEKRQTRYGREIMKIIQGRLLRKGSKAPPFRMQDTKGQKLSLEQFRGRYVLLIFWASWCMPCIDEIPVLKKIKAENAPSFLQILSVSADTDTVAFRKMTERFEMDWPQVVGNKEVINQYGATPVPAIYLISPEGLVLYSLFEGDSMTVTELIDRLKKN